MITAQEARAIADKKNYKDENMWAEIHKRVLEVAQNGGYFTNVAIPEIFVKYGEIEQRLKEMGFLVVSVRYDDRNREQIFRLEWA